MANKWNNKLISDEKSDIKITPILLENKQSKIQPINIFCDFTSDKPETKHCILNFNVDGKNYGKQLILNVNIKEHEKVKQLRDEFKLSKNEYDSKRLLSAINKVNGDINKAFESLFV